MQNFKILNYLVTVFMLYACLCLFAESTEHTGKEKHSSSISNAVTTNKVFINNTHRQKKEKKMKEIKSGTWSPDFTDSEKRTLFSVAEDTLQWCVNKPETNFSFESYDITDSLKKEFATFVTLKIHDRLRGCIGSLTAQAPVYKSVHENAINAALNDYRFPKVQSNELNLISIDVSVLSPIKQIPSIDQFKIFEQGIIIEKRGRSAVFLPEVAKEQGWTKEETLSQLSLKAGLPPDAWKEDTEYKVFESVVIFMEKE
jgi:AmmeMemoRadiSam system protein A